MTSTAKKSQTEPVKTTSMPITNIQKVGALRFHGDGGEVPLGNYVEILPGETKNVPMDIWNRYEGRENIAAMDRIQFVVGGLKPGDSMLAPGAQSRALDVREKDLAAREQEVDDKLAAAEKYVAELEAAKAKLSSR